MRDEITKIFTPTAPSPTIGDRGLRLHQRALRRRIDFYIGGRIHAFIVILPLLYGAVQVQRGRVLEPWFWWTVAAAGFLAVAVRRPPYLRLTPRGILFPAKHSPLYPWDQMCEAHSRADEMEIVLASGEPIKISYRKMSNGQIERLKRVVKSQFQWISQQAKAPIAKAA